MNNMRRMLGILAVGSSLVLPACTKPTVSPTRGVEISVADGGAIIQWDDDRDSGTADAGDVVGGNDGGVVADGGRPPRDASIGASCSLISREEQQSTCEAGLTCIPYIGVYGMCTRTGCVDDAECGVNGSVQNVCVQNGSDGQRSCFRGCDVTAANACGREDFACVPNAGPNGVAICLPDCRTPFNDCPYLQQCTQGTGQCESRPKCTSGGSSCAAGTVCYSETAEGQSVTECVPDCTLRGNECPNGRECDWFDTRACKPLVKSYYEECGPNVGICDSISACVRFDDSRLSGVCLQSCRIDEDCPTHLGTSKCILPVTDGIKVCTVECVQEISSCTRSTVCKTLKDPSGDTYGPLCAY